MTTRLDVVVVVLVLALALSSLEVSGDSQKSDKTGPTTGPSGSIDIVKSWVARARSTVQSRPAGVNGNVEIQRVAQGLFDFNEMARRALGQHWQALSPQERNEFVQLFTGGLKQFFVAIVERYSGEWVAVMGEEVAGGYARVHSKVIPRVGSEISIKYRVFESGSRWAVYDVVFDGRQESRVKLS